MVEPPLSFQCAPGVFGNLLPQPVVGGVFVHPPVVLFYYCGIFTPVDVAPVDLAFGAFFTHRAALACGRVVTLESESSRPAL